MTPIDTPSASPPNTTLAAVLFLLSVLSAISGFTLCLVFLPGGPEHVVYGSTAAAYTTSIAFAIAGVVQSALFAAVGQVVNLLHRIELNTRPKTGSDTKKIAIDAATS